MKKFLVFLVSIVVVVCFGLTAYYFMRNDEVINVQTKEIYCNAGDIISLDALNIDVKKPHRKTVFNYNAGGEEVTNLISYDETKGYYQVASNAGGEVDLVISTTNKKFAEFKVRVHIGNGSVENPYYVFSETDLNKIGSVYRLDNSYSLMNNIILTNSFKPIGYSEASESYVGFSGNFYGNGYSISGLNLNSSDYANAGLFYSLNEGSMVKELTVNNANINGSYQNAGVLAGTIAGVVEKVAITNSSITNNADNSFTGSLAGVYSGSSLRISYADNVIITIGTLVSEPEQPELPEDGADQEGATPVSEEIENVQLTNVVVGGLVGKLVETTATATYVNNANLYMLNADGVAGGYAGEFVINTNKGSIQQSYSNVNSTYSNFAGFVGKVVEGNGFNAEDSNMLTHFIGNIAVVNGKTEIADSDIVKIYNTNYFVNKVDANESVFFNENNSLYLIRGFASAGSVVETNEYVFYAVDVLNKTLWDTTYVWQLNSVSMPSLIMGSIEPAGVSGEYFRKDLTQIQVSEQTMNFEEIFNGDVSDVKVTLMEDVVISENYVPANITNCSIDGNNKTITINLNKTNSGLLGLFASVNKCDIKNLNIVITGVGANATNIGGLAGTIQSSDETISTISNVKVTYQNEIAISATNFGGVAGVVSGTTMNNVSVEGLSVNGNIDNVGAIVGELTSGTIQNAIATATFTALNNLGGVAAVNKGVIVDTNVTVELIYNKQTESAKVGGVVAINDGSIVNTSANAKINVQNAKTSLYVGGVVAVNNGTIELVTVSGEGIALASTNATINVGGVVAVNSGKITSTYNYLSNIGACHTGLNYKVGGVAVTNNGEISKVITSSNLKGNIVAGVVVEMTQGGTIDQVVVGNYDKENKTLNANSIEGDKFVAGIAFDFRLGTISNVQASSNLKGLASTTRTSLIVLIFPNGAKFTNATINSSMSGYGTFYRDSWSNFANYSNKADFGFADANGISYFNICQSTSYCGELTSVVINSNYDNNVSVKKSYAIVTNFIVIPSGDDYNGINYIKEVYNFNDVNNFKGSFSFDYGYNDLYDSYRSADKTLDFEIGVNDIWVENNGIMLNFLASL